jgi:WD40 repeat protein
MKALVLKKFKHRLYGHKESICGVFSPQGDKGGILVTVSKDGYLRAWDVFQKKKITTQSLNRDPERPVAEGDDSSHKGSEKFDPFEIIESCIFNQKTVFCGYSDGSIYAFNMKTGNLIYKFQGHEDKVSSMVWIDPHTFVSSSYDETIVFWDSMVSLF